MCSHIESAVRVDDIYVVVEQVCRMDILRFDHESGVTTCDPIAIFNHASNSAYNMAPGNHINVIHGKCHPLLKTIRATTYRHES